MSTNGYEVVALGTMFVVISFGLQTVHGVCHIGLGMMTGDIRDYQITASSSYSIWTQPFAGRLWNHRRPKDESFGGWCAMYGDDNPYLQVEFKKHKVITALATQGLDFPSGNWVTKYAVNYSCDGKFWQTYQSHNNNTVLSGNSDGYSVQKNTLDNAIIGRVIRIRAVDWNPYGVVCIRAELYGCDVTPDGGYEDCSVAAGMESREITKQQITASSFMPQHHPSQGRLHNVLQRVNGSAVWGSWCTHTVDVSQYIQVDLAVVRNITGIATQGSQLGNWVTKYVVNYSVDGLEWKTFRNESGTVQVFQGNTDELTVKKNAFGRRLVARFVRINPRAWRTLGQICMRMEIYVCQLYQGCPKATPLASKTTTSTLRKSHMSTTTFQVTRQTHRLKATKTAATASMIPTTKPQRTAIESVVRKRYSGGTTINTHSDWLVLTTFLCWLIQFENW